MGNDAVGRQDCGSKVALLSIESSQAWKAAKQ